jgi:hypothetical protein
VPLVALGLAAAVDARRGRRRCPVELRTRPAYEVVERRRVDGIEHVTSVYELI